MRSPLILLMAAALCAGCRSEDTIAAATLVALADVLPRVPEGHVPYLASGWTIPVRGGVEPIPRELLETVQQACGLPLAPEGFAARPDSTMAVLHMFRPLIVQPYSVIVLMDWAVLGAGAGGHGWGVEYLYTMDCSRECRIVGEMRGGRWN